MKLFTGYLVRQVGGVGPFMTIEASSTDELLSHARAQIPRNWGWSRSEIMLASWKPAAPPSHVRPMWR